METNITLEMVEWLESTMKIYQKSEKLRRIHCTNPKCRRFYHKNPYDISWFSGHGSYETKAFGTIKRYICLECSRTFSDQSFHINYYVKKPVQYIPLIRALVSTSGQGNLSRFGHMRSEQIQNRYERLCRMLLALHAQLRAKITASENFAFDGFESFSRSQFYPNHINILAGSESEFIYSLGFSQLRRKGRMTEQQKIKRIDEEEEHGKAPKKAIEMSMASLVTDLGKFMNNKKIEKKNLYTDEHPAYPRALKRILDSGDFFNHIRINSKRPRTYQNHLFPVNYIDRQIRKDSANHVRETVQFARCPAAMMARLTIYQFYHNYLIPKRVSAQRKGDWKTRGEMLGISKQTILTTIKESWNRRPFSHLISLWEEEKKTWLMLWRNSRIKIGRRIPDYIRV